MARTGRRRKGDTTPTQSELAKTLGVSRRTVQRWDRQRELLGKDPEYAQQTQKAQRTRVELLAARAAFRRAIKTSKEQGGFINEDWAIVDDLYRDVALLLYPED